MASEIDRREYVLNDNGAIWTSIYGPTYWNFGQFEDGILDATLHVLHMDNRLQTSRGLNKLKDPVWLGRILSGTVKKCFETFLTENFLAVANSANENGILTGNWKNEWLDSNGKPIPGCTRPSLWSGSVKDSKFCPISYRRYDLTHVIDFGSY